MIILPLALTELNDLVSYEDVAQPVAPTLPNMVIALMPTLIGILVMIFIISCVLRIVRGIGGIRKEHTLIRMELGKLAEEVRLMREKADGAGTCQ